MKYGRLCQAGMALVLVLMVSHLALAETVWLSDLDLSKVQQGWQGPRGDKSVDGNTMTIAGVKYEKGLGTHADSILYIDVKGAARFTAKVGLDDEVGGNRGTAIFKVVANTKELFSSGVMKTGEAAKSLDVDLAGIKQILLIVESTEDGMNYDHADWVDARFEVTGEKPKTVAAPREEAIILTPKAGPEPRINGARVFGVRPGHPVLYLVAATGQRPMSFGAKGLPDGVKLNEQTGLMTGAVAKDGAYEIELTAKNSLGQASRKFKLVVGSVIALTPPMGWNSWNCWGCAVDETKIRSSAKAMVESGLVNHGWSYINIDDCWMRKPGDTNELLGGPLRDEQNMLVCNGKFPDMTGLIDYLHGLGLKAGTYISPGPTTCAGFAGSYKFEEQDAIQFARWGFDYLKYDWCSYGGVSGGDSLEALQKPYKLMKSCLDKVDRDIVFSLCQYGMGDVWKWGEEVGGNCWRTTGDITDSWGSMAGIGFSQDKCAPFGGPGHWNDPDMLVVGKVGWGPSLRASRLTPNEQYTHISLWCLQSSPLLIGCDLADLDEFTLNLLTNDEVLAVSQDPLGLPSQRIIKEGQSELWHKQLDDGGRAVGLFNRSEFEREITVTWADLKIAGGQTVRDLWRQKDLGVFKEAYKVTVPRHGVAFIKVAPAAQ